MKHKYLKNVATLAVRPDNCTGCGRCTEVCPHNVFELLGSKIQIIAKDSCMECGACARNCSFDALQVRPGVGCAYAIIMGKLLGTEPTCGCSEDSGTNCC